jgi:hypothetical protein
MGSDKLESGGYYSNQKHSFRKFKNRDSAEVAKRPFRLFVIFNNQIIWNLTTHQDEALQSQIGVLKCQISKISKKILEKFSVY